MKILFGGKTNSSWLIQLLRSPSWRTRKLAAKYLGRLKEPKATMPLVSVLLDTRLEVIREATEALKCIGNPKIVPTLLNMLGNDNPVVTSNIVEILGALSDAQAVEPLLKLLSITRKASHMNLFNNDPGNQDPVTWLQDQKLTIMGYQMIQRGVIKSLGDLKDARAVPILIEYLKNPDFIEDSAIALGKIKDRRAVEALVNVIEAGTEGFSSFWVCQALEKITGEGSLWETPQWLAWWKETQGKKAPFADQQTNSLVAECPGCQARYKVSEAHVGKKIRCKKCQAVIDISLSGAGLASAFPSEKVPASSAAGSDHCPRCSAGLQWFSSKVLRGSGVPVDGLESIDNCPDDFAGACTDCRDGFCLEHAPNYCCPKCSKTLIKK